MQCIEGCLLLPCIRKELPVAGSVDTYQSIQEKLSVAGLVDTEVCKRRCRGQVLCMDMKKGGK